MIKAFPVIIDRQCPNLFRSIGIKRWGGGGLDLTSSLEAKFRVLITYIFGGKIWGSNKNFGSKFWGQAPQPPYMEVPPPHD